MERVEEYGPVDRSTERERLARRLNNLLSAAVGVALAYALWELARGIFGLGMDATDADNWHRSGLQLHTDNATGCQYVSRSGGLTPRLDKMGQPICSGPTQ